MNIAFSAIVAIALFLPGLVFLRVRRRPVLDRGPLPPVPQPFSTEAALAVCYAAILHVVWYGVLSLSFAPAARSIFSDPSIQIQPAAIAMYLSGKYGPGDVHSDWAVDCLARHPIWITLYFLGLYAATASAALRYGTGIDDYFGSVGLYPSHEVRTREWNDFFFPKPGMTTLVTAVVDMGGKAYLFAGELKGLYFSPTGELDRLKMENVSKRFLDGNDSEFEEVFGDQFLLWHAEIKTLNVIYTQTQPASSGPTIRPSGLSRWWIALAAFLGWSAWYFWGR